MRHIIKRLKLPDLHCQKDTIMRYYIEKFGAIELPREHPFSIGFTGNATTRIREAYNYVWTEDNS